MPWVFDKHEHLFLLKEPPGRTEGSSLEPSGPANFLPTFPFSHPNQLELVVCHL